MTGRASFFAELKRRNVWRAAVFYAGAAWLLVQIATQVFPFFHIPEWVVRWIVIAAIIGFPFAMAFSWFYEWTPQGIRRESDVARDASITRQTGRTLDRWIIAVLSLAVVLLLADKFVLHRPAAADKSIAVLPFANTSGDQDNEYFSDGLSEELISSLSRVADLKVIGRTSSFRFKGKTEDTAAIGTALGVAYLLEGSVRKSADRVRIAVSLQKSGDGVNVWSQSYDRELKDIFAVQSDIAREVSSSLQVKLLGGKAPSETGSVEAHNAYLKGHAAFESRSDAGWLQAVAHFDEAIALDPGYALAYAERAQAHSWYADQIGVDIADHRAAARRDAEKSVALDANLAEAHTALGWVLYFDAWEFDAALAQLRIAEKLAPGSAKIQGVLSHVLCTMGQIDAALAAARKSVELDPLYAYAHAMLARSLAAAGQLDAAADAGRRMAEVGPTVSRSHLNQVTAAVLRGDGETALREAQLEPAAFYRRYLLSLAQWARGDRAAADAALADQIALIGNGGGYQIAVVYAFRGDTDKTFEWLQRAYDQHDSGLLTMGCDPMLNNLHGDPRFAAWLKKMGLPAVAGGAR
jgi:TolB-like protein/Tfp pilus assembly protein PilF